MLRILNSKITNNIFWLILERIFQFIIGIVITGLLARALGPSGYGIYQYASAIIVIGLSLTYICGSDVLVPIISKQSDSLVGVTLYNTFIIRLIASLISFLALIVFILFSNYDYELKMLLGIWGVVILINEPFAVIKGWMEANTFIKPNVFIRVTALIIKLLFVFYLFKAGLKVYWIGLIMVTETFLTSLGQFIYFNKNFKVQINFKVRPQLLKFLFKRGSLFWIGLVFMYLFTKIDKLILKNYISFDQLGIYTSAMGITDSFSAIAPIFSTSFAPIMIYKEKILTQVNRNLLKILAIMIIVSSAGALAITFGADLIVKIILGSSFSSASSLLVFSIWSSLLVFIDAALNLIILKNGAFRIIIAKWFSALLVNVIVIYATVSFFGYYAGLLGISAGYLTSVIITAAYIINYNRKSKSGLQTY